MSILFLIFALVGMGFGFLTTIQLIKYKHKHNTYKKWVEEESQLIKVTSHEAFAKAIGLTHARTDQLDSIIFRALRQHDSKAKAKRQSDIVSEVLNLNCKTAAERLYVTHILSKYMFILSTDPTDLYKKKITIIRSMMIDAATSSTSMAEMKDFVEDLIIDEGLEDSVGGLKDGQVMPIDGGYSVAINISGLTEEERNEKIKKTIENSLGNMKGMGFDEPDGEVEEHEIEPSTKTSTDEDRSISKL